MMLNAESQSNAARMVKYWGRSKQEISSSRERRAVHSASRYARTYAENLLRQHPDFHAVIVNGADADVEIQKLGIRATVVSVAGLDKAIEQRGAGNIHLVQINRGELDIPAIGRLLETVSEKLPGILVAINFNSSKGIPSLSMFETARLSRMSREMGYSMGESEPGLMTMATASAPKQRPQQAARFEEARVS